MNDKKHFYKTSPAGLVLGVLLLATLTGCIGYVDGPRAEVQVAPPVFVAQDDYVYYPGYDVYYSSHRRQYAYLEGGAWVSRPGPPGISVRVLRDSPSVRMEFHDSPSHHHAEVVQQYPRNWTPPGSKHGQDRKDDKRSDHGGNGDR